MKNVAHELDGSRLWRYAHNISGGLQEYIEALSFFHYVEGGGLVSYEQVQANLSDDAGQPVRTVIGSQLPPDATKLMRHHRFRLSPAFSSTVIRLCSWDI